MLWCKKKTRIYVISFFLDFFSLSIFSQWFIESIQSRFAMRYPNPEDRMDVARTDRDLVTYYVAKALGFLPFTGGYKILPFLYSALWWTSYISSGIYITVRTYRKTKNVPSEYSMPRKVKSIVIIIKKK